MLHSCCHIYFLCHVFRIVFFPLFLLVVLFHSFIVFLFIVAPWCSGYRYCTNSFNKAWIQVLRRFKFCWPRVEDLRWRESLTVVRLEIRVNTFRRLTIPQEKFIIMIIQLFSNVAPINTINTSLFYIIVVTVAILYIRSYIH